MLYQIRTAINEFDYNISLSCRIVKRLFHAFIPDSRSKLGAFWYCPTEDRVTSLQDCIEACRSPPDEFICGSINYIIYSMLCERILVDVSCLRARFNPIYRHIKIINC